MDHQPASKGKQPPAPPFKWNLGYILAVVALLFVFNDLIFRERHTETIPYSDFLRYLDEGKVDKIVISETSLEGELKTADSGKLSHFTTIAPEDPTLVHTLHGKGVAFRREANTPFWGSLVSWVVPLFFFYLLWTFVMRRAQGGSPGGLFSMAKSKVKVFMEKDVKTTFADVAGVDEAKAELNEVVSFLKEPARYARLGGRVPKGILLVGPPGTGKTLLARAVAGEASVPFFMINGSEFVELFVGLGAARVRDLFEQAKKSAPCILFIDEIDALGKSRAIGLSGIASNDEKEQTLNQLLAEMDGFDPREGVVLLAATNRPEILDQALLRAGRFDRQILVDYPDQAGREQILKVHLKKIKVDPALVPARVASLTAGFTGADLANLVNEAALVATRRNAETVAEPDFTQAIERIVAGLEQKRKIINPAEKKRVAVHEMGHATVALAAGKTEKVHKVSIIPRGLGALGYTLQRPSEDRYIMDEDELVAKVAMLLGGRAAEMAVFDKASTGAADDLVKATDVARAMVVRHGMSDKLGLASYDVQRAKYLAALPMFEGQPGASDYTARVIDSEVRRILEESFALATKVIMRNQTFLGHGVERLLASETLDEVELLALWEKHGVKTPVEVATERKWASHFPLITESADKGESTNRV